MQNEFKSPSDGATAKVHVDKGAPVETGAKLVEVQVEDAVRMSTNGRLNVST